MASDLRARKGAEKTNRIPIRIEPRAVVLPKPAWLRVHSPLRTEVGELKTILRAHGLHTVCEEASCPNIGECFSHGTATFMIMGQLCTRRCPFCDVAHGRPEPLNQDEPQALGLVVRDMGLKYVVITSVDRDDLRDGGAGHFRDCVRAVRAAAPGIEIELLVPDFRGRVEVALGLLGEAPPDVLNHNLETVPRLYAKARPGALYEGSLMLLRRFKERHADVPTKSGIMVGLGETADEVQAVMKDLRDHGCDLLTIGQYLQPSRDYHLPVERYVTPDEFAEYERLGLALGFRHVASGPLVRSSYHADQQAAMARTRSV